MKPTAKLLFISLLIFSIFLFSVYAKETEGLNPEWQTSITENLFTYKPIEFSGCVIDSQFERVFVSNRNGYVVSLNSNNGEIKWRFSLKHPIHLKPVLKEQTLFLASTGGKITSLDVSKKYPSILWEIELSGGIISDITIDENNIFVLTERNILYSISARDGTINYHKTNDFIESFTLYSNTPITVVGEKIIYTLSTGELYVINRNDGKIIYKLNIYNPEEKIDGFTGLIADNKNIILSTLSGFLYNIETDTGKIIWSRKLNEISTITKAENKDIFVFCVNGVISVYDLDGKIIKEKLFLRQRIVGADIHNNRVIVRYSDGKILLLSKDRLQLLSSLRLSSPVIASITYDNKYAYLFSSKGSLIKFLIK